MSGPVTNMDYIRTVGDLYAADLLPSSSDSVEFAYNPRLNDKVSLWSGKITGLNVEMVVNAANESLLGGGGVDNAIHRAAGPELKEECRELGGAKTGQTKVTLGYNLPAKYIAHTVGPKYDEDLPDSDRLLESCYRSSLMACVMNSCKSIAFPCISTGAFGYPLDDATSIALETTRKFLETEQGDKIERVVFVTYREEEEDVYRNYIPLFFPGPPPEYSENDYID